MTTKNKHGRFPFLEHLENGDDVTVDELAGGVLGPGLILQSRFAEMLGDEMSEFIVDEDKGEIRFGDKAFRIESMGRHHLKNSKWSWEGRNGRLNRPSAAGTYKDQLNSLAAKAKAYADEKNLLPLKEDVVECDWESQHDHVLASLAIGSVEDDVVYFHVPSNDKNDPGHQIYFVKNPPKEIFEYPLLADEIVEAVDMLDYLADIDHRTLISSMLEWAGVMFEDNGTDELVAYLGSDNPSHGHETLVFRIGRGKTGRPKIKNITSYPTKNLKA